MRNDFMKFVVSSLVFLVFLSGCTALETIRGESTVMQLIPCDLDFDEDCDDTDFSIFQNVLGECVGGGNYNEPADADHDGCITLKDQYSLFPERTGSPNLLECSRLPGYSRNIDACPNGYVCYEDLSGGLGPEGAIPIESDGGDKKCHQSCATDSDCPIETPNCITKKIKSEDMVEGFRLCFA